jgi:hypothetical protein
MLARSRRGAEMIWTIALCVAAGAQDLSLEERLMATVPETLELEGPPRTGPDGREWPNVQPVVWAPDGSRVAYVGMAGEALVPVIGEEQGEPVDLAAAPVFGGAHVAFRVGERKGRAKEEWAVLVDGERVHREDWIGAPAISADGERLAFWTQPGAKIGRDGAYEKGDQVLVLAQLKKDKWKLSKGRKWDDAQSLVPPRFDGDGNAVTCAQDKGEWTVLRFDGRREKELVEPRSWIAEFALSPIGEEVACVVMDFDPSARDRRQAAKWAIRVGEAAFGSAFGGVGAPLFSSDGGHLAFKARSGLRMSVAIDREEATGGLHDYVCGLAFRPDGEELAFIAVDELEGRAARPLMAAVEGMVQGGEWKVLRRGLEGPATKQTGGVYDEVRDLAWSPDGAHLAFRARDGAGWHVVVDGQAGAAFDEVGPPRWSADSAHVAHGARRERELWW